MKALGRWAAFGVCIVMLGALALFAAQHPGWVLLGGLGICAVFWRRGAKHERENKEVERITRETQRLMRETERNLRRAGGSGRYGRAPDGKPWN